MSTGRRRPAPPRTTGQEAPAGSAPPAGARAESPPAEAVRTATRMAATGGVGGSTWSFLTDPSSLVPTLLGVAAVVAGFALLFVAWAEVAGQADVYRQMPYVISSAFPGLGLIMVGLVVVNVSVRRQEGAKRARQMEALADVLDDLRGVLER